MELQLRNSQNQLSKKVPRAAVIIPPIQDFYFTAHRFSSIGSHIVVDLLKKAHIPSTLINFPLMMRKGTSIKLPGELSYLKPFIIENETGKASFFRTYKLFGPHLDSCVETISQLQPDICYFSCFAFCYSTPALELCRILKKQFPKIITVFGGAGVSAYPEYFLKDESVDFTLSGEAEINTCDFISYLTSNKPAPESISGLGWKENGTKYFSAVKTVTNADQINCPVIKTEERNKEIFLTVSLSRGCPSGCNFCSNWLCHGKEFRRCTQNTADDIINQITEFCFTSKKTACINFEDDNLLFDYPFWLQIIRTIKNRLPNAKFYAENGIDYRLLNIDRCEELIACGFSQFNFSLGSVNKMIMTNAGRQNHLEKFNTIVSYISKFKIPVITYFICGFKDDTTESVAHNLAFLSKHSTMIGISLYYPVPGIQGFEDRALFDKVPPFLCCGSSAYPWNLSLSTQTMITAFRLTRIINLSKSSFTSLEEKRLLDLFYKHKRLYTFQKTKSGSMEIVEVANQDYELVRLYCELM